MNRIEEHLNNILKFFITKQEEYKMIEECFIITSKKSLDELAKKVYLATHDKISEMLNSNSQLLLIQTGHTIEGWSNCEYLIKRINNLFKLLKIDHFFDFDRAKLFANSFGYYSGEFALPILQMPNEKELEQSYKLNIVEGAVFISRYYKDYLICVLRKTNEKIYVLETNGKWITTRNTNSLNGDRDIEYIAENKNTRKKFIKSIFSVKSIN